MPFENRRSVTLVVLYFDFIFTKDDSFFNVKKDIIFQLALSREKRTEYFQFEERY